MSFYFYSRVLLSALYLLSVAGGSWKVKVKLPRGLFAGSYFCRSSPCPTLPLGLLLCCSGHILPLGDLEFISSGYSQIDSLGLVRSGAMLPLGLVCLGDLLPSSFPDLDQVCESDGTKLCLGLLNSASGTKECLGLLL